MVEGSIHSSKEAPATYTDSAKGFLAYASYLSTILCSRVRYRSALSTASNLLHTPHAQGTEAIDDAKAAAVDAKDSAIASGKQALDDASKKANEAKQS